ncbi:hypothetical protein ABT246_37780 [Streptomyces sp. NPDC001553]|uniref:hypothetical protein n=1 Tax=Streptomyces sp. NPDC001553 TaxID=3154385 RepID=UPI0033232606
MLRSWLDNADLRVDDVLIKLKPEHFISGKIPSRTTLSERLAGIGVRFDFVEALADICSEDVSSRQKKMDQFHALTDETTAEPPAQGQQAEAVGLALELVAVQKRSLDVSDKLTRAMERVTDLERERSTANHMVLVLLAMVDKLQRDATLLGRERERRHVADATLLPDIEVRLSRSEEQRRKAEAELERAREERSRADHLAEEAAEQVRTLTEELERLRGRQPLREEAQRDDITALLLPGVSDQTPDDMDIALTKAARHLEDSSRRLDSFAVEIDRDNWTDNWPNNRPASTAASDNWIEASVEPAVSSFALLSPSESALIHTISGIRRMGANEAAEQMLRVAGESMRPTKVPALLTALRENDGHADVSLFLAAAAKSRTSMELKEIIGALRSNNEYNDVHEILENIGSQRPYADVSDVLDVLDEADIPWVISAAGKNRSLRDLQSLSEELAGRWANESANLNLHFERRREDLEYDFRLDVRTIAGDPFIAPETSYPDSGFPWAANDEF